MARSQNFASLVEPTGVKIPRAKKGSGKWPCIFIDCPTRLSRKADVQRHVEIHSNHTIYKHPCTICPYSARQKVNLNAHVFRRHQKQKGSPDPEPESCCPRSLAKRKAPKAKGKDEHLDAIVANLNCGLLYPMYVPQAKRSCSATTSTYSPRSATFGLSTSNTPHSTHIGSHPPSPKTPYTPETPLSSPPTYASPHPNPPCASSLSCTPAYTPTVATSRSFINSPPRPPVLLPSTIWNSAPSITSLASRASVYDKGRHLEALTPTPSQDIYCERADAITHQANMQCPPAYYHLPPPLAHSYWSSHGEYDGYGGYVPAPSQTVGIAHQIPTPSYPVSYSSAASRDSFYLYNPYLSRPVANYHYGLSGQAVYC